MSVVAAANTNSRDVAIEGILYTADLLDVGLVAVDADLRITHWNSTLQTWTGIPIEEAVGGHLLDFFPSITATHREEAFRRAALGETVLLSHALHEYLLPIPVNGAGTREFEHRQQSGRVVPLPGSSPRPGAVAFMQDVSERVTREKALREAKESAESSSRAKSEFLAAMSHELRTPLSAVIGYAGLLTQGIGGELGEKQKSHVERITASAWHLIGVIDQVLTFSRAEAGREELAIQSVDLCASARIAIMIVEPQAQEKNLQVRLHTEYEPMQMQTDPLRVQQILINLLGNAVKFTDEGTIDVTVSSSTTDFMITVKDTGPGVPPSHRALVFEAFTQVDQTATRQKGGTGLGLAVSLKLAELLGGGLELADTEGTGSTFVLRLPRG